MSLAVSPLKPDINSAILAATKIRELKHRYPMLRRCEIFLKHLEEDIVLYIVLPPQGKDVMDWVASAWNDELDDDVAALIGHSVFYVLSCNEVHGGRDTDGNLEPV